MSLKKGKEKKKANLSEPSKPLLTFKIHNSWNSILEHNQKAQTLTNLILNDEIKKNQFKKFSKVKKKRQSKQWQSNLIGKMRMK